MRFGIARVSCERKLKYAYAPHSEDRSWIYSMRWDALCPRNTHAVCLTLLPAHQKEHVLVLVPCPWKRDKEGEEVPNDLYQDIAMANEALCGDENYWFLGEGVMLISGKAQQVYFEGHASLH